LLARAAAEGASSSRGAAAWGGVSLVGS